MAQHPFSETDNDGFAIVLFQEDNMANVVGVLTGYETRDEAQQYVTDRPEIIGWCRYAIVPVEGV